ncbi:pre-mRNA-splicing factor 38B-like [Haliotis rubra]|uniref:pre-mRNA-splicing factor 38B-like n=1 Tax=Haliotis rubra TaxID=36100 RepID=UPI001EE6115E|nr:pre-mRNA-splicing factor 38B-like [Haliotis rubra]
MAPNNALPVWGNEKTMNLNTLILTNIQSSPYFKVNLFELKTYHEVIDEIYYKVMHLEPWEKGSRKTAGQTGMCGGVRGVGAGGIVSSAYCLLYKLFTLKLTKKQLIGLITHADSPYIRGLGFMYIRAAKAVKARYVTQLRGLCGDKWHSLLLLLLQEIDVKAGGGHAITIGELCRQYLVKLEWYSTLFPRIPVPVQKSIQEKLKTRPALRPAAEETEFIPHERNREEDVSFGEAERAANRRSPPRRHRSRSPRRSPHRRPSPRRSPRRSPQRRHSPRRSSPRQERERDRERRGQVDDFARELEREKERQRREKEKDHKREKERRKEKDSHRSRDTQSSHGRDRREEGRNKEKRRSHSRERHERSKSRDKSRRSRSREKHEKSHSEDRVERSERHKHRSTDEHREKRRSRSREPKRSRSKEKSRDKHGRSREDKDKDSNREHKRNRHDGENGES